MDVLEGRRTLLEDLEIIEDAISSRLSRNPEIYYGYIEKRGEITNDSSQIPSTSQINSNKIGKQRKSKRSKKQIMLQQHEIALFLIESFRKMKELATINGPLNLEALRDDSNSFEAFTEMLEDIDSKYDSVENSGALEINEKIHEYAMFSGSNSSGHPTTTKSLKANNLDLNKLFSRDEQYGEYMELEKFHSGWYFVIKGTNCSLLQFFNILELFLDNQKYLLEPPMDRKNERYLTFLENLSTYLESFFKKSNVLLDHKLFDRLILKKFQNYLETPLRHETKGFFSVASSKWFKTESVFKSYLMGKNHKKSVAKRYDGLLAEYKVHSYLKLLAREFKHTKEFVERKLAFTAEERIEEMAKLNNNYNSPDYSLEEKEDGTTEQSESESTRKSALVTGPSADLPLGPDGLPMPYWLFKLQGLDVTYSCEICGNLTFKGRRAFEKHFTESTHLFRLRCLGIDPSPVFKGITSIKEAMDLSKRIAKYVEPSAKIQLKDEKMEVEVEDDDGNVMTQRIFEELKKQGLV